MSKVKPTFGREMEPCEYSSKWANKLPKEEVISIKAETTRTKPHVAKDEER